MHTSNANDTPSFEQAARSCAVCSCHPTATRWPWCEHCHPVVTRGWKWTVVAGVALGGAVSMRQGWIAGSWAFVFGTFLALLAGIDARSHLLPNRLTLPLLKIGLAVNLFGVFAPFHEAALGAATSYGLYWLLSWASALVSGRVALGRGDAVLLAGIGAWLGYRDLLLVQGIAAGAGLLYVSWHWLRGRGNLQTEIPFGPWLALGGTTALLLR